MEMPEGYKINGHIIRIRKGLYGLEQAAALWLDDVRGVLPSRECFLLQQMDGHTQIEKVIYLQ